MDARRRLTSAIAVLAALALLATACQPADDPDPETEAEPTPDETVDDEGVEVLRMAGREAGFLTPFGYRGGPGSIMAGFTFDTLLWRDSTGEPIPWLAEDWEADEELRSWTFILREDVTWHDGEPFTADDIVFTFEYLKTGPGADTGVASTVELVSDVVAEDDHTVVFELERPYTPFEERVAISMMIVPRHIWEDVDDPAQYQEDDALVGTGPYQLQEFDEAAGSYLFTANEDFYLGVPHVRRLEFVPAPDELLALERGEIDVAEPFADAVPDEQLESLEAQGFEALIGAGDTVQALYLNLEEGFPYDDERYRHALAYAIDREDMVDRILLGRGQPGSTGNLAPEHPMVAPDLPDYALDVEQAEELLDELGITDADGDGWRQLPDGSPFVQELVAGGRFASSIVDLTLEYLREVGIQVEPQVLESAAADDAIEEGNYTLAHIGYGGVDRDPDFLRPRFAAPHMSETDGSRARGYDNPEFNDLADEQLEVADPDEREDLVQDMQRILAEDLPVLPLFVIERLTVYDPEPFDAYYHTPGCSPCFGSRNKHMLVTGQ